MSDIYDLPPWEEMDPLERAAVDASCDEERPAEDYCPHCGKAFDEFGDLGCGYCDRRSPEWGIMP